MPINSRALHSTIKVDASVEPHSKTTTHSKRWQNIWLSEITDQLGDYNDMSAV